MYRVRFRMASLLGLAGLLYVAQFVCGLDATTMLLVLFGAACLAISTLMFKNLQFADYAGGIIALAGLWAADAEIGRIPVLLNLALLALDLLVAAGCLYLVFKDRRMALRVAEHRPG